MTFILERKDETVQMMDWDESDVCDWSSIESILDTKFAKKIMNWVENE